MVQVTSCLLFGAKPLTEPMMTYCHLGTKKWISVKFESKFTQTLSGNRLDFSATQPTPAGAIFNTLAHGRFGCDFKCLVYNHILVTCWASSAQSLSDECYRFSIMISQYWFRQWCDAARQRVITSANACQIPKKTPTHFTEPICRSDIVFSTRWFLLFPGATDLQQIC